MKKTERHHVTAVSLEGFDWSENIMVVTKYEHDIIHATLNIPYSKIRIFRKKTNHMTSKASQAYVNELRKVHVAFFQRLHLLPQKLQNGMRDCMRETTKRVVKEHNITIKLPADNKDLHSWLRAYHNVLTMR